MSSKAQYIKQRLSMRKPLQEALDIVDHIQSTLKFQKGQELKPVEEEMKKLYPGFKSFDRDFPSICFSIATGIGKTRLMGACIAYLYLEKGIRNFFVLAPNLTIYEKLMEDFGNPSSAKYVFNGISEFVHNRPVIITGDNYNTAGALFAKSEIRINVFNISKFNKDAASPRGKEKGQLPRIKRLSEYLGQSYWDYLSGLDDLVILMDEAHRYKADSSAAAINELKPLFGIELSATPIDEKGNAFSNVVFEYNLAQALAEGKYVKNPAVAYRTDFTPQGKSEEEIERIKLEDAISLHEDIKTELEVFATNTGRKKVKPFILVVCKDTTHARDVATYIQSKAFFNGAYAEKVIQIDSSVNDDENAKLLETVEHYDNPVEIVVHVNMLAEGWDVTNLYTICPLRRAESIKLIEQTIGRGLRLPYGGERVNEEKIDRLTVLAHENFNKVIEAAKDENSIMRRFSYVTLDGSGVVEKTVPVVSVSNVELEQHKEQEAATKIENPEKRQKAQTIVDAKQAVIAVLPNLAKLTGVKKLDDLKKPEIRQEAMKQIEDSLNKGQGNLFKEEIVAEAQEQYLSMIDNYKRNVIEIPKIDLVQDEVKTWFEDFDLDTTVGFDLRVLAEEIRVQGLVDDTMTKIGVIHGANYRQTPEAQIISAFWIFSEFDYDSCAPLVRKLVGQAMAKLRENVSDDAELSILVRQFYQTIASRIWTQMKLHFRKSEPNYGVPKVLAFTRIEPWGFNALAQNGYKDYRENIPGRDIQKYVFMGFSKACHPQYKFDSNSERIMARILEEDKAVLKWLRPAERQFRLYWSNNSKQYIPDFVVECEDVIYLLEVKAANQVDTSEVQDKKHAAETYCKYATEYNLQNGLKPWKYLLVGHDQIQENSTWGFVVSVAMG